jgi:hypothetical protein
VSEHRNRNHVSDRGHHYQYQISIYCNNNIIFVSRLSLCYTHLPPPLPISPLHRYYVGCVIQYMGKKKYYCSRAKKCKEMRREVDKTTYFRHMPHWDSDRLSKYSPSFQALLDKNPITVHKSPSQSAQSSRGRGGARTHMVHLMRTKTMRFILQQTIATIMRRHKPRARTGCCRSPTLSTQLV